MLGGRGMGHVVRVGGEGTFSNHISRVLVSRVGWLCTASHANVELIGVGNITYRNSS